MDDQAFGRNKRESEEITRKNRNNSTEDREGHEREKVLRSCRHRQARDFERPLFSVRYGACSSRTWKPISLFFCGGVAESGSGKGAMSWRMASKRVRICSSCPSILRSRSASLCAS